MDLIQVLRNKVAATDDGDHTVGLKAVLVHVESAFAHYSRGESSDDDTAFTDAIYRANQVFEGSVKEAYRVLTGKDPSKKTPHDIEKYLEANSILRARVLDQLSKYRSEWRNPSTHDYKLDFDRPEALFAIVSVAAFAAMLIDEIQQKLAFDKSQAEAAAAAAAAPKSEVDGISLMEEVQELLNQFCAAHMPVPPLGSIVSESQYIGAIQGFVSTTAPHLQVQSEFRLSETENARGDLQVSRNGEQVIIEVKRKLFISDLAKNLLQIDRYLNIAKIDRGILLYLPLEPGDLEAIPYQLGPRRILILSPEGFIAAPVYN